MTCRTQIRLDVDGAYGDGSFAPRLVAAAASRPDIPDSYGEGPVVRECEEMLARALGKERAVIFATGTLANLVALDRLCGRDARRVLLHPDSHILNDTGDSLVTGAGLTPVVAETAGPGFGAGAIAQALAAATRGKVYRTVGAIGIETPVRRQYGAMFPAAQLDEVVAAARNARIGLHLDGARLPIAAAARGMSMASFAAPYDTVYMSLWKMLGLPFGAVLAGPLALLDGIERDRRRLGGALPQFWPIAALVLAELDRLEADWMKTFEWRSALERALSNAGMATRSVGVETTNTFWLVPRKPATDFKMACKEAGVALADVAGDAILLRANPTALDIDPTDLARKLVTASV
jgi:threonine aldolase